MVSGVGCGVQSVGCRVSGVGYGVGCRVSGVEYKVQGVRCRVEGVRYGGEGTRRWSPILWLSFSFPIPAMSPFFETTIGLRTPTPQMSTPTGVPRSHDPLSPPRTTIGH